MLITFLTNRHEFFTWADMNNLQVSYFISQWIVFKSIFLNNKYINKDKVRLQTPTKKINMTTDFEIIVKLHVLYVRNMCHISCQLNVIYHSIYKLIFNI